MSSFKSGKKLTSNDFKKYLNNYIEFINKYDIKYFFELDIDVVVGYNKVLEMRKKLEECTGKKCIPVFHKNRGIQEWIKMCQEYDYVAIGCSGKNDSKWTRKHPEVIYKMLRIAKKYNCKVHGLGFTSKHVERFGFYSVDSTTWLNAGKFGKISRFDGRKILEIHKDEKNKRGKPNMLEFNLKEWLKYQKHLEKF